MIVASEENNDMHESIDNYDSDDLIEYPLMNMMLAILVAMMPIFMKKNLL